MILISEVEQSIKWAIAQWQSRVVTWYTTKASRVHFLSHSSVQILHSKEVFLQLSSVAKIEQFFHGFILFWLFCDHFYCSIETNNFEIAQQLQWFLSNCNFKLFVCNTKCILMGQTLIFKKWSINPPTYIFWPRMLLLPFNLNYLFSFNIHTFYLGSKLCKLQHDSINNSKAKSSSFDSSALKFPLTLEKYMHLGKRELWVLFSLAFVKKLVTTDWFTVLTIPGELCVFMAGLMEN